MKSIFLFGTFCFLMMNAMKQTTPLLNHNFTLIQEAQACSAYAECDGYRISCHGEFSCIAYPMEVVCDGNQSAQC